MDKESTCNSGDAGDMGSILGSERFPWRKTPQPTSVFLPGEPHGQRSLTGYSPYCQTELNTTGAARHACMHELSSWGAWAQQLGNVSSEPLKHVGS